MYDSDEPGAIVYYRSPYYGVYRVTIDRASQIMAFRLNLHSLGLLLEAVVYVLMIRIHSSSSNRPDCIASSTGFCADIMPFFFSL